MQNSFTEIELSVIRLQQNNFFGLMQAHESHLYASPNTGDYAPAAEYQAIIANFSGLAQIFLPLISINP